MQAAVAAALPAPLVVAAVVVGAAVEVAEAAVRAC